MGIGFWQVVLVLLIVLILFGAGKLPRVMGDLAKGIKSFKAGMNESSEDSGTSDGKQTEAIDAQAPGGEQPQAESREASGTGKN